MPLFSYPRQPIAQRVSDRVFGDQHIGQVATLAGFAVEFDPLTNELSLRLKTRVDLHVLSGGELGEMIPAGTRGIKSDFVYLYANNNCAVYFDPASPDDPRNGEILFYKSVLPPTAGQPVVHWQKMQEDGTLSEPALSLDDTDEPLWLQGDAFAAQLEYPLVLAQMIRHHMAAADKAPFNKYA